MSKIAKVGVLGASGYTGSECVRLLLRHPQVEIALLTADRKAGQEMREVFPQFSPFRLPKLVPLEGLDWATLGLDLVFCALPHGTTQKVIKDLLAKAPHLKVVDLSADFRLADTAAYARWYGDEHQAPELQKEAVYGLVEVHRERIRKSRLVANPGCYTTCAQLPLVPLIKAGAIDVDEIVVDAKSGMTGAGRAAKENMLFSEVSEGFHAYGVGHHRHMAELDQEFSARGRARRDRHLHAAPGADESRHPVDHLCPRRRRENHRRTCTPILSETYRDEPFVHVLPFGEMPQTRHVRGSNMTFIGVAADRIKGRAIIGSALDNLVKGASGQAVQNMNLVLGFPETMGLEQIALFP